MIGLLDFPFFILILGMNQKSNIMKNANRLTESLKLTLESDQKTNIINYLLNRHAELDEIHSDIQDDSTWDDFEEWETLQNWIEGTPDEDEGDHPLQPFILKTLKETIENYNPDDLEFYWIQMHIQYLEIGNPFHLLINMPEWIKKFHQITGQHWNRIPNPHERLDLITKELDTAIHKENWKIEGPDDKELMRFEFATDYSAELGWRTQSAEDGIYLCFGINDGDSRDNLAAAIKEYQFRLFELMEKILSDYFIDSLEDNFSYNFSFNYYAGDTIELTCNIPNTTL